MYLRLSNYLKSIYNVAINKFKYITYATMLYCIYGFSLLVENFCIIVTY